MALAGKSHFLFGSFSAVSTPIFAYKYSFFSIFRDLQDLQSPLSGEKKVHALFFSRKKNTFGGELRLGRPSRQRRAHRAPWGLPTPDVRSTLGQPWVSSLAISGRFSLILPDSSIKTEDRRTCISQMVDFPIRKRDFRVRAWSGAFWEPLERKKDKTKCSFKIVTLSHRSQRKKLAEFHLKISRFLQNFPKFCQHFRIF